MNFIKKDLLVIVVFIIIGIIMWFVCDYLLDPKLKITRVMLPVILTLFIFLLFLGPRIRYKKWILSRSEWRDFTGIASKSK